VRHPFKSVEIYDNYHEGTAAVSPDRQSVFQGSDEGIIELWYPNRSFGRDKSSFDLPRGLSKVKLDVDLETRDITIQTEARYTAGSTKSRVDPGTEGISTDVPTKKISLVQIHLVPRQEENTKLEVANRETPRTSLTT
jgi:hypothetical protein